MSYRLKMLIENDHGKMVCASVQLPDDIDLITPSGETEEMLLALARLTFARMRTEENVKPVNNLPKWF